MWEGGVVYHRNLLGGILVNTSSSGPLHPELGGGSPGGALQLGFALAKLCPYATLSLESPPPSVRGCLLYEVTPGRVR